MRKIHLTTLQAPRRSAASTLLATCIAVLAGAVTVATVAAAADAASSTHTPPTLLGFTADSSATELALEHRFDAALSASDQQAWLKKLADEPNQVGSPHDAQNARAIAEMLRSWGWDTRIETFYVLYPTPKREALELLAPTAFKASLHEPPVPGDPLTTQPGALPPYNAYGADGDVTADLVYVNYGMDDDYKELARRGVDVRGKIVIARYGQGWRGLKPKLAYEHGAIGCIIYSDPHEDGYAPGDVYPKGGWRPREGVQRGSVADMTLYSGDPLTPGVGATKDAKRLSIAEAKTILKIPVIPISYGDAQPLLAALAGPVAPPAWRGSLPITYHLGAGPAKVHLTIFSNWGLKPLYDVIAIMKGSESPDEWVIRGNHHDGWVAGAWDPLAGAVAEFDEAKAIGALSKTGWRPKRTLIYASWDGEEPGLLGSTEWAEEHADELKSKAVLYVNTDTNGRGFLEIGGSHSLQRFVNQVETSVEDPETHVSVGARLRAHLQVDGFGARAREEDQQLASIAASGADLPLGALGSGSDYTPFLQHLGISSLDFGYSGEDEQAGVYHSLYDSYAHYVRFGDPGFGYGVAMSETGGHLMLRMAQADVLPLQFGDFAATVETYRQEVHRLAEERRKHAEDLARLLDQHAFTLASDPTHPLLPPQRAPQVPYLEFAALDNSVARLQRAAQSYDDAYARMLASGASLSDANRNELNDLLRGMEQALTDSRGLPGRPWYVHMLYAPGSLTGYGAKTLPGIREAIEQDRWADANQYIGITARALDAYSDRLERATALLPR
ncbi:MAG TPA: transferrin receptor-like dimerization domain-containing protein [Steroidobacteraceae bacterium]|nr:transferrin receptor-like dimerization domain-containing protein [Steroidobacteraceae bacterium]